MKYLLESTGFLDYHDSITFTPSIMKISSLQRIYIPNPIVLGEQIILDTDQTHYLTKVMRIKIDWQLRIFNEINGEFIAKISSIGRKSCILQVMKFFRPPVKLPSLCLAQSIIKGDKMTQALSMATQLGVTEIVPIITERTQLQTINYDRVTRILIENSEQSERLSIPKLYEPQTLDDFIINKDFDLLLYANENEQKMHVQNYDNISKIAILIGPEGGLTDSELEALASCSKACSVSLGTTVLRSETAAAALVAVVQIGRK